MTPTHLITQERRTQTSAREAPTESPFNGAARSIPEGQLGRTSHKDCHGDERKPHTSQTCRGRDSLCVHTILPSPPYVTARDSHHLCALAGEDCVISSTSSHQVVNVGTKLMSARLNAVAQTSGPHNDIPVDYSSGDPTMNGDSGRQSLVGIVK